jgi:hypothetical protein
MNNNNMEDNMLSHKIEMQRYQNTLTTYFMSKATGENQELLSISSAPGMGQMTLFAEVLFQVNEKIRSNNKSFDAEDKKNALNLLTFEAIQTHEDIYGLLKAKINAEPKKIFFVGGVDSLNAESREALVNLAKENNANVVFGATTAIPGNTYSVSTDMAKFIEEGKNVSSVSVLNMIKNVGEVTVPTKETQVDNKNLEMNYIVQSEAIFSKIRKSRQASGTDVSTEATKEDKNKPTI